MITRPRCRYCNREWVPAIGVAATQDYCRRCRKARREKAKRAFGLRPLTAADFDGPYLLPRARRGTGGPRIS